MEEIGLKLYILVLNQCFYDVKFKFKYFLALQHIFLLLAININLNFI